MAIKAIEWSMLRCKESLTLFVVLVDNITAASVINSGTCSFNQEIDAEISRLHTKAKENNQFILAIYIPGEQEPADEPSRELPLSIKKCQDALQYAVARIGTAFEKIYYSQ